QDRTDRRRADADPELAQLALDPHAAPARILPPQPQHQPPHPRIERRSTHAATPDRPLPRDQLAPPPHKRPRPNPERVGGAFIRIPRVSREIYPSPVRRSYFSRNDEGRVDHCAATPTVPLAPAFLPR